VPRADNAGLPAFIEFALMQRTGQVAANVRQDVDCLALAEDEQRHLGNHALRQLAFNEIVQWRQGMPTDRKAMRNILAVIYTGSLPVAEVPTKKAGSRNCGKTQVSKNLPLPLPAAGPLNQRREVKSGCCEVPRRVDEADALLLLVEVRPIGEACDSRRNRGDASDAD
jgi:hypothetical protein